MKETITIIVRRYDPEKKEKSCASYEVQTRQDMTILDALNEINASQKAGISLRFSCQMGICGSCGAMVNGKPILMCSHFCRDFSQPIVIEPMRHFPVIKDLVVETDKAMEKIRQVLPYTSIVQKKSAESAKQSPSELKKIDQTSQCIKCMLCYSACPVYALDQEFVGPAASATAYRYMKDNRDHAGEKRMDSVTAKDGVWKCSFVGECSNVCPKKVDPAKAIQKLKIMGVLHSAASIFKKKKT